MENITIGQIAAGLGIIAAILGGYKVLYDKLTDIVSDVVKELMKPLSEAIGTINGQLDDLSRRLEEVDMESCKNFLVRCIADLEKGEALGETEKERFYEQYDYYLDHDGNSYIRAKVEKLQTEGKI